MSGETFTCPECGTEMIRSPLDADFLMHVESTDCAPEPWPTADEARLIAAEEAEMGIDHDDRDYCDKERGT